MSPLAARSVSALTLPPSAGSSTVTEYVPTSRTASVPSALRATIRPSVSLRKTERGPSLPSPLVSVTGVPITGAVWVVTPTAAPGSSVPETERVQPTGSRILLGVPPVMTPSVTVPPVTLPETTGRPDSARVAAAGSQTPPPCPLFPVMLPPVMA